MARLNLTCAQCGTSYQRFPSGAGHYCSRNCYDLARKSTFDMRAWQDRNRADQNAKKAAWARENREKYLAMKKRWRERNKDAIAESTRARRLIYSTGATKQDIAAVLATAEGRCTYCDQPADRLELDHVDPIAQGANHHIDNILPACRTCNASKSDAPVEEWLFAKFGMAGLARAIVMLEQRKRFA